MYTIKLVPDTQTTHLGTTEALNKLKSLEGDQASNQPTNGITYTNII